MPTYTLNPTSTVTGLDWSSPVIWLPNGVPDAADDSVLLPLITNSAKPYNGAPYPFTVTIDASDSYVVQSLTMVDESLDISGSLSVVGAFAMESVSEVAVEVDVAGSLAIGSLANPSLEITGSGQISSPGSIENQGLIDGDGLTLDFATLQNDGTLWADGGNLVVDLTSGAAGFANLSDGTLSLGTYEAGPGETLDLNVAAAIVTDAANIILDGTPGLTPVIETTGAGGTADPLTQTLQTIAPDGSVTLEDAAFAGTNALVDAGIVLLDQGTLTAPSLTIEAGGDIAGSGTIIGPVTDDGFLAVGTTGELALYGGVSGSGTIAIQATTQNLDLAQYDEMNTLEIAGADANAVAFGGSYSALVVDNPALFEGEISGFTSSLAYYPEVGPFENELVPTLESDAVILMGINIDSITNVSYSGTTTTGTLTIESTGGTFTLGFEGDFTTDNFLVAAGPQVLSNSPPSVEITDNPCFLHGTRLMTDRGEVAVEQLAVGDPIRTPLAGGSAPVLWIGRRRVDCRRHQRPWDVWPVRIAPGAFGPGLPHRTLWLSPDHAVFTGGVLIPVRYLVNGATVVQQECDEASYWHVELPRHAVLLAEGLPTESYLDTGNRGSFANGGGAVQLHPDFARGVWQTRACAPLVVAGPQLAGAQRRLLDRAAELGHVMLGDPELNVLVDGRALPAATEGRRWHVRLPEATMSVRLASRRWVPAQMRPGETDPRVLGVAIARLWLDGREVSLDSPALAVGWHAPETGWRWTDGDAGLSLPGVRALAFEVAMTGRYWRGERCGKTQAA